VNNDRKVDDILVLRTEMLVSMAAPSRLALGLVIGRNDGGKANGDQT
jgi:hypothetical protein